VTLPGRLVLLGHPVAQSRSPRMQNAALERAGLPIRYEALDVAPSELDEAIDQLVRANAAGNVTYPHKEAVYERCSARSPIARRVGAVNTFWCEHGALVGDNTDVGGFSAAVESLIGGVPAGPIALLGAGGAAAAVCAAAEQWGSPRVRVLARDSQRATRLASRFPELATVAARVDEVLDGASLVVNATPLGMRDDDALPVPVASIQSDAAVMDLVYRPGETRLVQAARARGLRAGDGLSMLVEQGALAFERWFGRVADRDAMWRAVR
jgi:shikimate dehydrogenase